MQILKLAIIAPFFLLTPHFTITKAVKPVTPVAPVKAAPVPAPQPTPPTPAPEPPPPPPIPAAPQSFPFAAVGTYANPYPYGQCTWLVASMKGNIPIWGDASNWDDNARAQGITVSDTPLVGSVGVERTGNHVVLVTAVNDGTVTIEEGNYDYAGSIRAYIYPTSRFDYIYI